MFYLCPGASQEISQPCYGDTRCFMFPLASLTQHKGIICAFSVKMSDQVEQLHYTTEHNQVES